MLLDFSVYNPVNASHAHKSFRACSADLQPDTRLQASDNETPEVTNANSSMEKVQVPLQAGWTSCNTTTTPVAQVVDVVEQIQYQVSHGISTNGTTMFGYSGQTVVGVYMGPRVKEQGVASKALESFLSRLRSLPSQQIPENLFYQLCNGTRSARSAKYGFGILVNTKGSVSLVQDAVKTWKTGQCITWHEDSSTVQLVSISVPVPPTASPSKSSTITGNMNKTATGPLQARSTCTTVQVYGGDTCTSLAAECKPAITLAQLESYNPSVCSVPLQPGQHLCCSSGTMPDFSPKPNADGVCYEYYVNAQDTCSGIAAAYSLTVAKLESYNTKTWGWMGCGDLQAYSIICLSSGSPPMPAPITNAVCGPQVPYTEAPSAGTDLSTLNPCPLNACCDIWGQCGTTKEFCTITQSTTGAPGTAAPNTNGCISNCGSAIVTGSPPAQFKKVGYFEGYNEPRPCLNEPLRSVDYTKYTHIHLGFGVITSSFTIDVSSISDQFNQFLRLPQGVKKVLSIGGWTFSTDPSTYNLFRQAVLPANSPTFIANIVAFMQKYGIDGIDFDWEYPGEPDILNIPAGSKDEGPNYLLFLFNLRQSLNSKLPGATISIAAPASFWYLQAFPIGGMSLFVDYIIFMTYDLHGQWDFSNKWSDPNCPGGNCLRSGVNMTETLNALSMITKANVPSSKIVVGVTSYGRSFQMTTPGCTTEMCTYTGSGSGAFAGICTGTPGYIANAEIAYLNATMPAGSTLSYLDNSFSNVFVYDSTQWVAYMDDTNKAQRATLYQELSMGGTTDWAIDLQGSAQSLIDTCGRPASSNGPFPACVSSSSNLQVCTGGTGDTAHLLLCLYSCSYGYCPLPCTCTSTGPPRQKPIVPPSADSLYVCPAGQLDSTFSGLCTLSCYYGFCPTSSCTSSTTPIACDPPWVNLDNAAPSSSLTDQSTCADLQNVHQDIKAFMWDQMNIPTQLKQFFDKHSIKNDFVHQFMDELGLGVSKGKPCETVTDTCTPVDCANLNSVYDKHGSAWQYVVTESIINMNEYLYRISDAASKASLNYTARAPVLITAFSEAKDSDNFLLIEIITAIGVGVAALLTLTGGAVAGAAGVLFAGIATEFANWLATLSSDSKYVAADFAIGALDWSSNFTHTIQQQWTQKISSGSDVLNTFAKGVWADQNTIGLLSGQVHVDDVSAFYTDVLVAGTVNSLWTGSSIYLYCMEMTQDEFNNNKVPLATGLSLYTSEGYGCYFQGISQHTTNASPIYYDPPGYEAIVDGTMYRFTTADIIQSSFSTFMSHGFNYTPSAQDSMQAMLSMTDQNMQNNALWRMDGTFNLPVCIPAKGTTMTKFDYYLNSNENGGHGAPASWCLCGDDKNGKEFNTFVPIVDTVTCICDTAGCPVTDAVKGVGNHTLSE